MVFLNEEKAQVEAADVLAVALLVSFSSFLIATYGLGSYREDLQMAALQHRYVEELGQSFILTSGYVSGKINYTIGPQEGFSKLSEVIKAATGASPLERNVKGSIFDLIAQDLYLSLAFHQGNKSFPINNWFLTENFHREVENLITTEFNFLAGGNFNYRIEASYHPYRSMEEDKVFFSEQVYTNSNLPKKSDIYIASFYIPVFAYNNAQNFILIKNFSECLDNDLFHILPSSINVSGSSIHFLQAINEIDLVLKIIEGKPPSTEYAEIKMMVWPKGEG